MTWLKIIAGLILLVSLSGCISSAVYTNQVQEKWPAAGVFTPFEGGRLHYYDAGTGDVVMLIHGASANAREFTSTLMPKLEDRHRVLVPDRAGLGYSDTFDGSATLAGQARAMAAVLDAAGGKPAVVVGHSYGGAVALRLALDRPDLVKGLVLLAPVTHDWGGGGVAWYNTVASVPVGGFLFSQLVPIAGPNVLSGGLDSVFAPSPVPPDYVEDSGVKLLFRPPAFRANGAQMTTLQDELAAQESRYSELSMPVIIFSGAKDTVIKPQLHAGKIVKQSDNVEIVKLQDEGHMPHYGHADEISATIDRLANTASVS